MSRLTRTDWHRSDFRLSARTKIDVREALGLLEGSGLTLAEAARIATSGKRQIQRITVGEAVERFQLSRSRRVTRRGQPLRPATLEWYEDFLAYLVRDFRAEPIDGINRTRFSNWLHALKIGETARTSIARAARALWLWSLKENPPLVTENVTVGLAFSPPIRPESERLVLTVEQAETMLRGAGSARSALALMLFAGLRPEEIAGDDKERLRWEHVNVSERWIRVPETISKTTKTRLIERLPAALWLWLEPGPLTAPISPMNHRYVRRRAQLAAGLRALPFDVFRHTAASYLLAFAQDAGRVAEWIGHEGRPTMLHSTYRGQLTLDHTQINEAMARRYFALVPPELARERARLLSLFAPRPLVSAAARVTISPQKKRLNPSRPRVVNGRTP
jgi:integrase